MNDTHDHELRALLLACIVTVWIVAGSVGFAGGVVAQSDHQLSTSDGAGGNGSSLFTDVEHQLPEGNESGDDTLRVEATNDPLPQDFFGELSLDESGELVFNTTQSPDDVELVVIGDEGSKASAESDENIAVTDIAAKTVEFQVSYEETNLFGQNEDPVAVEVSNLSFDAGTNESVTLTWDIANEEAGYELTVEHFDGDLTATDENGGGGAQVTAGAENQPMVGYYTDFDTEPARNLVLSADEDEFPTEFQATVTVDRENVTFNESLTEEDVLASSSNEDADVTVDSVENDEISVTVSNFDGTEEDATIVELEGVTYDVAADAMVDSATWEVLGQNDSYTLVPEYLDASFKQGTYEITRGQNKQPDDGATVVISAEAKETDGFHNQARGMTLEIPSEHQDDLQFAADSQPKATMFLNGDVNVSVSTHQILLMGFPDDVDSGDTVTISNITFNTTEYNATEVDRDATFESGLDIQYEPIDNGAEDRVSNSTKSEALDVRVPEISFENGAPTDLPLGTNGTTGDTALELNVTDTSGGQMASGTDVVIGIEDVDGLTFDESQEDDLQLRETVSFYAATDISVEGDRIVVSIADFADSSQKGESVILEHEDGNGIRFNTTDAEVGDASLSVQTNASDAPVRQTTDTAAEVQPADVQMSTDDGPLTVGIPSDITVTVTDGDGEPLTGVEVMAVGEFDSEPDTVESNADGEATFNDLTPANDTDVSFEATEFDASTEPVTVEYANLTASPDQISAEETTDVVVTLTDASGDGIENQTLNATSDRLEEPVTDSTDASGQATLTLNASEDGTEDVTISVEELDSVGTVVDVREANLAVEPRAITPGEVTTVDLTLTDSDGNAISDVNVSIASGPVDAEPTNRTDAEGHATLDVEPTEPGTIVLEARDDGEQLATNDTEAVANISLNPETISAHEESNVTVTVTGANDEPLDGIQVDASGDPIADASEETEDGEVVFTFEPGQGGDVTVAADELGVQTTLVVSGLSVDADADTINATADAKDVTFTVEDHDGNAVDATVEVVDGPAENATADTDDNGHAILTLDPTDVGTISVQASTDDGNTANTTVDSVASMSVSPLNITAGENESVSVTVSGVDDAGLEGVDVTASGEPLDEDVEGTTDGNGDAVLQLETVEPGTIDVTADNLSLDHEVEAKAAIEANRTQIEPGQETDVQVTLTGADGGIEGAELEASGPPIEGAINETTDSNGEAVFTFDPDSEGDITITAAAHGVDTVVKVEDTSSDGGSGGGTGGDDGSDDDTGSGDDDGSDDDSGSNDGGSGGGGGGAAPPEPAPDVEITSTSINETTIDVGDAVAVTVTVENVGDGDGEYTVGLTSGGFTLASETVEVPAGETREVTLVHEFGEEGSFDLAINGEAEVGTLYVGVEPAEVTASETVELVDEAPEEPGVYVTCENVAVRSITFHDESASGAVTIEELSRVPLDATQPEGTVIQVVSIDVPDGLENDAATIEFAVDADRLDGVDASTDDLTVVHYDESADAWAELDTEVVESDGEQVVVAAETPGFSMFAVTAQDDEQPSTPTETPTPTATDSGPDSSTPTETTGTAPLPEEQSGIPNPFVLGGLLFALIILGLLTVAGKRLYDNGGP